MEIIARVLHQCKNSLKKAKKKKKKRMHVVIGHFSQIAGDIALKVNVI